MLTNPKIIVFKIVFKSYNFTQDIFDTRSPAEIYLYIAIIKEQNKKAEDSTKTHQYVTPESIAKGSMSGGID